jgi:predicted esterase
MKEYSFQTSVSGRYLLRLPSGSDPAPLFVGFHGYGQRAEDALALLSAMPGSSGWLCCAIEALHSFYTSGGGVGASWMTSRNREQRIAENVHYTDGVIRQITAQHETGGRLFYHGFSQGAGMACRAALLGRYRAEGVMLLGGDIPPELDFSGCSLRVHLAKGSHDRIYTQERFEQDQARLKDAAVSFSATLFTGGHAATEEYLGAAGEFLSAE